MNISFYALRKLNFKEQIIWTASSEFGTYRLCEQRRFRRACASAQSRQNLRCSLIQAVSQEEPSDRKPDPWSLWMAGHAQLKFVMTECSKTQIRLTRPICSCCIFFYLSLTNFAFMHSIVNVATLILHKQRCGIDFADRVNTGMARSCMWEINVKVRWGNIR